MRSIRTDKTQGGGGDTPKAGFCGQYFLLILLFCFAVATLHMLTSAQRGDYILPILHVTVNSIWKYFLKSE